MTSGRTPGSALAAAGLFALGLLGFQLLAGASQAHAQELAKGMTTGTNGRAAVKYVYSVDYPLGGKDKYIAWVNRVAKDLMAPDEVKRITSYDDYFGASPHRVVEFEFDSIEDAGRYFAHEKVRAVFDDVPRYGLKANVRVLLLRGDYTPR